MWWGHRIPVWDLQVNEESIDSNVEEKLIPKLAALMKDGRLAVYRPQIVEPDSVMPLLATSWSRICLRNPDADQALVDELEAAGYVRDNDVLDTWFSSALWPISTMGWPDPTAFPGEFPEGTKLIETFIMTSMPLAMA